MTYDKAELVALDKKYVWHHLTQHKNFEPAIYVKGEGMRITDIDGKLYTDVAAFKEYAADFEIGHQVTLTVYRPRETDENPAADASSSEKSEEPVEYDALGEITVAMVDQQDIS